jgi:hypothetical protein
MRKLQEKILRHRMGLGATLCLALIGGLMWLGRPKPVELQALDPGLSALRDSLAATVKNLRQATEVRP